MREHLYRGKRVDNGEWVYGDLIKDYLSGQYFIHPYGDSANESDKVGEEGCLRFFSFEVIPETICEYTGLTDKNGNKIFEGDIVEYNDEECFYPEEFTRFIGEIVFESGAFGVGSHKNLPIALENWCNNDNYVSLWELYWNLNCTQCELSMLEVIGNIYDRPELLEK